MRAAVIFLLLAVAAPAAYAASCTPQCKEWTSPVFSVQGSFVPCTLSMTDVRIIAATNVYTQSGPSTTECAASGSGTQLSISVPTGDTGSALLTWTYATYPPGLCEQLLTSDHTDAGLRLLGFSMTVQSGLMHSWPEGALSAAACARVVAEIATAVEEDHCYSNQGTPAIARGVTNTSATARVEWHFRTNFAGSAVEAQVTFNGADLAVPGSAALSCAYNLGTSLLQVYDSVNGAWALSWQYTTYVSCAELIELLVAGNDDLPRVESIVVARAGDQVYLWERDASKGQTTVQLSDYENQCDLPPPPDPSSPSPSSAPLPPNATLAVSPVVNCYSRPAHGPCRVHFGYYNPNQHTVTLAADTSANQLVRQPLIKLVDNTTVPSHFEPGWHNNTIRVEFPCSPNRKSGAGATWKLRTAVSPEVAAKMDDVRCLFGCRHDIAYDVLACTGLVHDILLDDAPLNGDKDTEPVLQCARAVFGAVPECA